MQHDDDISNDEMRKSLKEDVIFEVVPMKYLDDNTIGAMIFLKIKVFIKNVKF